jgi:hypothetical protein
MTDAQSMTDAISLSLSGEATKLVIDNYLRSLTYGCKYVFQTLPKILTLWLEHASVVDQPMDPKRGDNEYVPTNFNGIIALAYLRDQINQGIPATCPCSAT